MGIARSKCYKKDVGEGRDVRGPRSRGVDGETNASETCSAIAATTTRDVERHRHDVSLLEMKHLRRLLQKCTVGMPQQHVARKEDGANDLEG